MSVQEASTPSSTTGSTAGSPPPSHPPATPLTPNSTEFGSLSTPIDGENVVTSPTTTNPGPGKRKANRRANTAERRATHNAVERARRETLNGRFLDLAALLPNLATVRRPSKSAIVNSSIALIHQSRRTRLLAARELRLIRAESDALRRELNEWRARAGLPRVEEPPRSPEFLNLISPQDVEGAGGIGGWDGERLGEMGEEERRAYELVMQEREEEGMDDDDGDFVRMNPAFKGPASTPAAPTPNAGQINNQLSILQQQQQRQQQISFARGLGFDSMPSHPALSAGVHTMYEPNGFPHGASHALPVNPDFAVQAQQLGHDKLGGWGATGQTPMGLFLGQQPQWTHQLAGNFTPPASAGGSGSPLSGNPFFLQQQQAAAVQQHMFASPEIDDASSVGSADGISGGSAGGSPVPFDINGGTGASYGRKPNLSISLPGAPWTQQQQQQQQQISVGGGGGRHLNALMSIM